MFKNNIHPRHSISGKVNRHFSNVRIGGADLQTRDVLEVVGNINVEGKIKINQVDIIEHVSLPVDTTFIDGNEANGKVLTVDDDGNVFNSSKLWFTNDNPELTNGPSDDNIHTLHSVGIGTTEPIELLEVKTADTEGVKFSNLSIIQDSFNLSTITHSDLKAEPTSYSMQINSNGETRINAKTDIEFSNNDTENMVLTNIGDLGVGITNPSVKLHVNGDSIIEGDLTVNGNLTSISSTNLEIEDVNIHLGKGNSGDTSDIGFFGQYSSTKYTGLLRDASSGDSRYILFNNGDTEPGTFLSGTYDLGNLELENVILNNGITAANGVSYNNNAVNLTSTGSLGLGVPAPLTKLDILGEGRFSGSVGIKTYPVAEYSLYVDSTDAIRVPSGTLAQRPSTEIVGAIRYNTTSGNFEGFDGLLWVNMSTGSIFDSDLDTYIVAEESPDDDHLRFYTSGSQSMTISNTGKIGINNAIPAVSLDINKTDAVYLPSGTTLQRPTPVAGYIRYNSDKGVIEGYDTSWKSMIGLTDDDQDTYITVEESVDEDIIRFYNAGTEKMTLNSSGNLGIGISLPLVSLHINDTDAISIPSGTSAQRPSGVAGYIRYNSDIAAFEGYSTSWEVLSGVRDADNDTYITAEETADEDKLKFYTAGSENMVIDETGKVGIGVGSPSTLLDVGGTITTDDLIVDNTVIINGTLTINGSLTSVSSTNIVIEDTLIKLGDGNIVDTVDLGLYGQYYNTGVTKYFGMYRDATDNKIKIFTDLEAEPTTTVNTAGIGYTKGILEVLELDTEDIKYTTSIMNIKDSGDTVRATLNSSGFLAVGPNTATYPLHIQTANSSSWSGRFTNGTTDVFIANDSVNGMLIDSGAADTNTSYALTVQSDKSNILYVENDGKIGVLTSTPGNLLDINTVITGEGIKSGIGFFGNASGTITMLSHNSFAGALTDAAITQSSAGLTSINSSSGQVINFKKNNSIIANFNTSDNLVLGTPSDSTKKLSVGGSVFIEDDLLIGTNTLFADQSTNKIGIGTNNPQETLHVSSNAGVVLSDIDNSITDAFVLRMYETAGLITDTNYFSLNVDFLSVTESMTFNFYNTGVAQEIITMKKDQKVGIKNINPQAELDVTGNTIISGNLTVDTNTLYVNSSTNRVGVGITTPTKTFEVNGDAFINGDLTISGDIDIQSSIIQSLVIEDPLIKLGENNTADLVDLGFYGLYNDGVNNTYTGLVRDATTGEYQLFDNLLTEPTSTVSAFTGTKLNLGELTASGTITCLDITTTSDIRAKDNIKLKKINHEKLLDLNIYEYTFKNSKEKTLGIIAQDLEDILPEAIHHIKNGSIEDFKTIKQNVLTTALLSTIQHLNERIKILEKK